MELNRNLDAERWNRVYEQGLKEYEDQFRARVKDLFQSGYFVGQEPFRNHEEEAATMAPLLPYLTMLTLAPFDPDDPALEWRKQRAQQMLRRYEEITVERQAPA